MRCCANLAAIDPAIADAAALTASSRNHCEVMCCVPAKKHVGLVQAVYPRGKAAAPKPNSSELQYLAFYTASRPKKLVKVGRYLQQRTGKDIYWQRQTDVLVTTEICSTLIEKCRANLSLFALPVLELIRSILATREPLQVERACRTFAVFCEFHNASGFESEQLFAAYLAVLRELCTIAEAPKTADQDPNELVSLQALATASSRLYAADLPPQLDLMVKCASACLASVSTSVLQSARLKIDRRESNTVAQPQSMTDTALLILTRLFDSNSPQQIQYTTERVLHASVDENWLRTILQVLLEWTPIDLRFHIVNSCLALDEPRSIGLVKALLSSRASLVGLSIVDVLESLSVLLQKNIDDPALRTEFGETVALLTAHTHYRMQLTDIASCLLGNVSDTETGIMLLSCLRTVLDEARRGSDAVALAIWSRHVGLLFLPHIQTVVVDTLAHHLEMSDKPQDPQALQHLVSALHRFAPNPALPRLCDTLLPLLDGRSALLMLHLLHSIEALESLTRFNQRFGLPQHLSLQEASTELARRLDVPELPEEGLFANGSHRSTSAASARTSSRAVSRSAGHSAAAVSQVAQLKAAVRLPTAGRTTAPPVAMTTHVVDELFEGIELQAMAQASRATAGSGFQ